MADADLRRLREDLATMRQAAGMELPFGREDVWLSLATGVTGLVAVVWALLNPGHRASWGLIPALIVIVGYGIRLRVKFRASTGRSPTRRREYTFSFVLAGLIAAAALVYRLWARQLAIPFPYVQGTAIFFAGLLVAGIALTSRGRLYAIGIAIPMMLCGLAVPLLKMHPVLLFGIAMTAAGPVMAAIQNCQLRKQQAAHAAD